MCGDYMKVGKNVILYDAELGDNVTIMDNVVIGKQPFKAKLSATTDMKKYPPAKIGNNVTIGTNVIIYAGAVIGNNVYIADGAIIREEVTIGDNTIIGCNSVIENKTVIGKNCKIETKAYICAYSTIEDYCFIGPGVVFTNDNYVGRDKERFKHYKGPHLKRGARIAAGVVILPGVIIGEDSLIGAGSVVTRDTEQGWIYYGCPAKKIKLVDEKQLLKNNI